MKYYPIFLNLKGRRVLIIGAGRVTFQKLPQLLQCQAKILVVAPQALPEIKRLSRDGKIEWFARPYRAADLKGVSLMIAATDDPDLQKKVAKDAQGRGIWANIVDVPRLCDFIAPAIVSRGDIQIAISTGGAAPALAKHLRQKLEGLIGQDYADLVDVIKKLRPDILRLTKKRRASIWERVVNEAFFDKIRRHGIAQAETRLKEWIHAR